MIRRLRTAALAAALATGGAAASGCAHTKITNRQVAIGAAIGVAAIVLVVLAVEQCHKGATFCDNEANSP